MTDVMSLNSARALQKNDNTLWTVEDCLLDVLADLRDGKIDPNAVLVLCLKHGGGAYDISWAASNLSGSQQIALMSRATHLMHREMDGD